MTTVAVHSVPYTSLLLPDLRLKRKESVLHEMALAAQQVRAVRNVELVHDALLKRERWCPSAIGKGVAVPSARSLGVGESRLVVARSRRGLEWGAPDGLPVTLVLMVLSPSEISLESHLQRIAHAVQLTRSQRNRQRLLESEDPRIVATLLRELVS